MTSLLLVYLISINSFANDFQVEDMNNKTADQSHIGDLQRSIQTLDPKALQQQNAQMNVSGEQMKQLMEQLKQTQEVMKQRNEQLEKLLKE